MSLLGRGSAQWADPKLWSSGSVTQFGIFLRSICNTYLPALLLGKSGGGLADAVGIDGAVGGAVERPVDVVDVHQRVELLGLLGAQHVRLDPEELAESVQPLVLVQPLL